MINNQNQNDNKTADGKAINQLMELARSLESRSQGTRRGSSQRHEVHGHCAMGSWAARSSQLWPRQLGVTPQPPYSNQKLVRGQA